MSDGIRWSKEFVVIDSTPQWREFLRGIGRVRVPWIVISQRRDRRLYAIRHAEILSWLASGVDITNVEMDSQASLDEVLRLHAPLAGTTMPVEGRHPPVEVTMRRDTYEVTPRRYVIVDLDFTPTRVGEIIGGGIERKRRGGRGSFPALEEGRNEASAGSQGSGLGYQERVRGSPPARERDDASAGSSDGRPERKRRVRGGRSRPPAPPAPAPPPSKDSASGPKLRALQDDEGTTPIRYPSIEIDRKLAPNTEFTLTVDLLRDPVAHTRGNAIDVGDLAPEWSELELTVRVQCAEIEFIGQPESTVTMRRNSTSIAATIRARVSSDAATGPTVVQATFLMGTRYCGSATRLLHIGDDARSAESPAPSRGVVSVDPKAVAPDLTVHISRIDTQRPNRFYWLVVTERFDGLPPKLDGEVDLSHDPAAEVTSLFKEFAVLVRGEHKKRIDGFGSELWQRAPEMFRRVYWALWDRHRRPLTIQFVSDDPHMPWELMRPVRADESEIHPPLSLKHVVARWIKRFDGFMRNRLPAGAIFTIAPKYKSASRQLKRAEAESAMLENEFAAHRESGTKGAVLKLLESSSPRESVAVLHFAGHGTFTSNAASSSSIKLEDGELAASEVGRPEVQLGRACRTLVFFNACEVGTTGTVFGEVGGWADAFLGREFGGFIAPLWSIDDEDAGIVASELLDKIFRHREPIGVALRAVREKHGDTSPTFYSYLYYGDVNACMGQPASAPTTATEAPSP